MRNKFWFTLKDWKSLEKSENLLLRDWTFSVFRVKCHFFLERNFPFVCLFVLFCFWSFLCFVLLFVLFCCFCLCFCWSLCFYWSLVCTLLRVYCVYWVTWPKENIGSNSLRERVTFYAKRWIFIHVRVHFHSFRVIFTPLEWKKSVLARVTFSIRCN